MRKNVTQYVFISFHSFRKIELHLEQFLISFILPLIEINYIIHNILNKTAQLLFESLVHFKGFDPCSVLYKNRPYTIPLVPTIIIILSYKTSKYIFEINLENTYQLKNVPKKIIFVGKH